MVRLPDLAGSLRDIAETGSESFYRGRLAEKTDAWSRRTGGWLRYDDLAAFRPEWVEPISVDYRGYTVWELPPNGHGPGGAHDAGHPGRAPAPGRLARERAPGHRSHEAGLCRRQTLHSRARRHGVYSRAAAQRGVSRLPARAHRTRGAPAGARHAGLRRARCISARPTPRGTW